MLAVSAVHAADPLACGTALGETLAERTALSEIRLENPATIQLEAGAFDAQLGAQPSASMTGGVILRRDDKLAGAETARFDPDNRALLLDGNVRYEDSGTQIHSDSAEFGYDLGRVRFEGAEFSLSNNGRGSASEIEINQNGTLKLGGVEYTTCPPGSEDWLLRGKSIKLDSREGIGTARGMQLRFKKVPVLWLPYLSFPITDARKTGILTPEIGSSGRSGNEIRVPFYWNIAPNYDATITPRILTSRGLQMETQFRYLTLRNEGTIAADYIANDRILDDSRHQVRFQHRTLFDNGWRNRTSFREVSDAQYFEDLGGSLSVSSITHLDRHLRFDYFTDRFGLFAQFQDYQTIDEAILPEDRPYRRLPQVLFNGTWPVGFMNLTFDSEAVDFDRDTGVTGWRVNARPTVELPIRRPGWFVVPAIALDHTRYELGDTLPGTEDKLERTVPISSLDAGVILERVMAGSKRVQTIEPRILYVNIPFRDQDALPVFDTILPDVNLVQLYRKNRYLGIDRIGDTEKVSLGVTSRIVDVATGRELVTATIGQTRYFSDRNVTLPGDPASTNETSDYIASLRFLLWADLNFDVGHQWGTGEGGTTKSEARLQYRPATDRVVNLSYRYRRDSLEQGDLSWSWPLTSRWNFVGRYNYSFRDAEPLEQFFGLEYESCCWGLRLVSRRYISTRDGTRDSSVGLQLVLKGMTSVGTAADKMLERGILGYSADLR